MPEKSTFSLLFIALAATLVVLPFATSFNELLTRIFEHFSFYRVFEEYWIPYVAKLLAAVLSFLPGLKIEKFASGVVVNGKDVWVTWNCLGWQSFLLFFVSLFVGLRGGFSRSSSLLTVLFGFCGTFLINLFRLAFTAALVGWCPSLFVILFHNYFSTFLTIIWLFLFWWFAYNFILEEKKLCYDDSIDE